MWRVLVVLWLSAGALSLCSAAEPPRSPLTPEQERQAYRITPGLKLELVAAEPQLESPVAMAFDEDGRLWVVEMRDYPNGPAPGKPPESRIKLLEDRDGDGRYETATIFADELLFANGVLPWRGGLLVTAAPYIMHLRDTDGDGKADKREVLYEGFAALNSQLRVSHPVLGPDNWVYVANGLRGGQVKRAGKPDAQPINLAGMDFRFDLVRDRAEAISGMGQYGNTFDDWGQRFVCDNRRHLRHVVLESRYVRRNPALAAGDLLHDTTELEPGPLNSGIRIYPLSRNWTTSNLHAGRFSAACGVFIYRGDLLPEAYRGCAFTCDPTGNLVHQEVLRPDGATFRSRPAKDGVEFLASPDDWSRPVFLAEGPDGAMYVVDMYRAVIEHPEFMPTELKNRPDLLLGKDRGRIWRIVPEKNERKSARPQLGKATTAELVALLEHPAAWWRTTAQRLLLERQDKTAVEPLRKLCTGSAKAQARLHAAWLLEALAGLNDDVVLQLLGDGHPRVRAQALLLAEGLLPRSAAIQQRVLALADDPDAQVRCQTALSLGAWDDERILPALAELGLAANGDRWTGIAIASAVPTRAAALVTALCRMPAGARPAAERFSLLPELAGLVGARREPAEVADLLDALWSLSGPGAASWRMAGLTGLADGMGRRGTQLSTFLTSLPADRRQAGERAAALLNEAAQAAADSTRPSADRLAALRLLAHASWPTAEPVLTRLLASEPTQEIRLAAVRALAGQPRPEVPGMLLKDWQSATPALRREITEAMFRQPERILLFLNAIEAGRVKPGDLDALRTRQLLSHGRKDIRELAQKLLRGNLPPDRKQVMDAYRDTLKLSGDARRGQIVFQKNCATCHRVAGLGVDVGPDISDTRTKTAEQLLTDILSPNQAIDNNYINYLVTTKNGRSLTGTISAETATSITLRRAENQTDVVLRQDIDEIQSTGVSLMPEGLEKNVPVADMADLLSFLKNWRYLDGAVPPGVAAPLSQEKKMP